MPKAAVKENELPLHLRAFDFHGITLTIKDTQANGDCPFCGRDDGKFGANVHTGLWECKSGSCAAKGNPLTFLRQLWEASDKATPDSKELAVDRKLLDEFTPMRWGAARSVISNEWLVAGWNQEGKLHNLYRRVRWWDAEERRWLQRPMATPGVWPEGKAQAMFGVNLFDPKIDDVLLCEGPWDGMAMWEACQFARRPCNVVAVPGANVFNEAWCKLFAGKRVTLCYDSDHPKPHKRTGNLMTPAGLAGMQRVAKMLAGHANPPAAISWLRWGEDGFDLELPSGWDVRDALSQGRTERERAVILDQLLSKVVPIPAEWLEDVRSAAVKGGHIEPEPCHSWNELVEAWKVALAWRQSIEDVLAVMLAVAASTVQVGDQLFLMVIAEPGSAKTRLCDGMLTSKSCFPLEHLTGFHSGYKDGSDDDFSLLARINNKTLITPEGDVLMSNPKFPELMSQQRRIFDGTSGASFKNMKVDQRYTGLRTPWILVGTHALLNSDQSRLGDRFIKVCIDQPTNAERRAILRSVVSTAIRSVKQTTNCAPDSTVDAAMLHAYKLTGGYVDFLRANMEDLIHRVAVDEAVLGDRCSALAEFTADLRARPNADKRAVEQHDSKEMPTRLTHQFVRLACCLAVVMNRDEVDHDVLRLVSKVAMDTSKGITLSIVNHVLGAGEAGATVEGVACAVNLGEDKARSLLGFLHAIDVLEPFRPARAAGFRPQHRWRLTERLRELWQIVVG